jgi:class 3 adenylate cyclase
MSMAQGGEILVSDLVRGLLQGRRYQFEDRGTHQLRGFRESVQIFSVDWQSASGASTVLGGTSQ